MEYSKCKSAADITSTLFTKPGWKDKTLSGLATMAFIKRQLRRLGAGKSSKPNVSPIFSLITDQIRQSKLTKRYRKCYASEVS